MNGRAWTKQDVAVLRSMLKRGARQYEIAERLGRTRWAVKSKVAELGIVTQPAPKPKPSNAKPKPERAYEKRKRKCLGEDCGRTFMSSWPGERICPNCRQREAFRTPFLQDCEVPR